MNKRDELNRYAPLQPSESPGTEETESLSALVKDMIAQARARAEADKLSTGSMGRLKNFESEQRFS